MLYTLTYTGLCINHISIKLGGQKKEKEMEFSGTVSASCGHLTFWGEVGLLCAVGLMLPHVHPIIGWNISLCLGGFLRDCCWGNETC